VAFHQVLAYRKRKNRDRLDFSEAFLQVVSEEVESRAEHLEKREHALQSCIAKLPADHRQALFLRYQDALSLEEMAERLQRTTTALYRLLSRVRQTLHGCVTRSLQTAEYE
jgi:RNA polymerase sigma-70 factor (ECF subfamily)